MKLWVDDLRTPPDDTWVWTKDSTRTILALEHAQWARGRGNTYWDIQVMSLDHDLGGLDTTRPVVLWCCEHNFWPDEVRVHSMNPVGRDWLTSMIERYKS